MFSYIYEISDTLNDKVNYDKLRLELDASELPDFVDVQPISVKENGVSSIKIQVICGSDLTPVQLDQSTPPIGLIQVINAHDGEPPKTDRASVNGREEIVRAISEMADIHPDLDENDATFYLTELDNHLNAWVRMGNPVALHAKVVADKDNGLHPQNGFLTSVIVTTGPNAGTQTWQFLIAKTS